MSDVFNFNPGGPRALPGVPGFDAVAKGAALAVLGFGRTRSRVLFRREEDGKLFSLLIDTGMVPRHGAEIEVYNGQLEELTPRQTRQVARLAAQAAPTPAPGA